MYLYLSVQHTLTYEEKIKADGHGEWEETQKFIFFCLYWCVHLHTQKKDLKQAAIRSDETFVFVSCSMSETSGVIESSRMYPYTHILYPSIVLSIAHEFQKKSAEKKFCLHFVILTKTHYLFTHPQDKFTCN